MIRWDWIADNLDQIAASVAEHLILTILAVWIGLAISLVAGLLIYDRRRLYGPTAGFFGILYTIPSLALFAFLVPITGLSLTSALIGLVSYTLLILLRNIMAGLDAVTPETREAAEAMGLSRAQRLVRVELPLALPVIVAGIRVATVTTIGLVMVTALIGQGGLGQLMLRGFNRSFPTMIYVGFVLTVALAIGLDLLLAWIGRVATPWARKGPG
ncbi:MAG TPA: ABC transporter permease [Candidatus Limnocylindrales bacterium]|nr:ABC transporter permease [Candidatus Limnocylindrales bacterium]